MSRNKILGVIGGVLIAISVFFDGNTATFTSGAFDSTVNLVLFLAGLAIILFLMIGNGTWAAYSTIAATTLALVAIIGMLRDGNFSFSVGFIVLLVGVVLALIATVFTRSGGRS